MRRTFYFLIVGSIALIWLANRMRLALIKLATGHAGDSALDMRYFGYTMEEVRGYFERLGADKRKLYLQIQTRIELAFILAYAIAGSASGIWISAAIYNENWKLVSWIPFIGALSIVAAAVVDLDEAQAIRVLIKSWPNLQDKAVARASKATRLKWLLIFSGLMMVIAGIIILVIAKLKMG